MSEFTTDGAGDALVIESTQTSIGPEAGLPPLPDAIFEADATEDDDLDAAMPAPVVAPRRRRLKGGAYLLRYTPRPARRRAARIHYDGTMRVERDATNSIASGDLYLHQPTVLGRLRPFLPPGRRSRTRRPGSRSSRVATTATTCA